MKELKLRAWSIEHKCYVDVWEITFGDEGLPGVLSFEYNGLLHQEPVHNFVIEQYTGLKDKNGKEIYEGDTLGDMWRDGYIAWCDKCKQLQYHILTHECMACLGDVQWYELVNDNGKLEVVGNVHENADLLEKK